MRDHLPLLFAFAACTWLPHLTCHYYVLETKSSFLVGSWHFTRLQSALFMLLYAALAGFNLLAIELAAIRPFALFTSATCHTILAVLHGYRLVHFFPFEVFGYRWSRGSSTRETFMELTLGVGFFLMGRSLM